MSEMDAGAAPVATEQTVTPAALPTMEDTMGKVFDKMEGGNGAERDATGRFAPKASTQDATAGATTGDADTKSSDTDSQKAAGAVTPTDTPKSWSDEEKAEFAKLPPEVQKIVLKRESDRDSGFTKKAEELASERKRFEGFTKVLAPIEAEAKKYNMPAEAAIAQMFERHVDLQRRGPEALKDLAKLYGIKLDGLTGGESNDGQAAHPDIAALKSENAQLKSRLDRFEQTQTTATRTAAERELDSVAQEKDKDGKTLRPHFEALYDDMVPIAAHLRAKNPDWSNAKILAEAYDRAANANPDIRAKLQAEAAQKAKAEEERKAKEAAKGARKAVGNNVRATGAHQAGAAKGKSWDDTMARVFDEKSAA